MPPEIDEETGETIETPEDLEEVLNFDPFAPGPPGGGEGDEGGDEPGDAGKVADLGKKAAAPEGEAEEGAGAEPTPAPAEGDAAAGPPEDGGAGEEPPPVEPAPAAPPEDPRDTQIALLQEQNQNLAAMLQTMQSQAQATAAAMAKPAEAAKAPKTEEDGTPLYEFEIPDGIIEGIQSEDRNHQKMAIASIVKGTAQAVHRQVMESMDGRFAEHTEGIAAASQQEGSNKQVFDDFYQHFPGLNMDGLRPLVQQAARAVIMETQAQGWTPQLRDLIGQRAVGMIKQLAQGYSPTAASAQVPAPAGAPQPQPGTKAPPAQVGVLSRPGVSKEEDVAAELEAMMFGR